MTDILSSFAGIEQRNPYDSERTYFEGNPHVAGMAAEDDRVILNPFSKLSKRELEQVLLNERARVYMRKYGPRPDFDITDEQRQSFSGYGQEQDIRETIAARFLSEDPSAGEGTTDQIGFAKRLMQMMMHAENFRNMGVE